MFLTGFLGGGVDRKQDLLGAPVELHVVVAAEREDHGANGRRLSFAHEVKVEHALHRPVLHAVNDGPRGLRRSDNGVLLTCGRWRLGLLASVGLLHLNQLPRRRRCGAGTQIRLGDHLLEPKGHGHHCRDVRLWAVDLHAQAQLVAGNLQLLQALKIVGPCPTAPDLDLVLLDLVREHLQSLDEPGEGGCHVSEVGNASADDQELSLRVLIPAHQRQNRLGIGKRLLCAGRSGVFTVVCQLFPPAVICHGVGVDH
mmetsp:Transcript_58068/g.136080  ORF Transcript_58068/g.136080 Transcript_58068/m.136080 type:complete len:255 (+) Transcript_58068:1687-2451(+)